MLNIFKTLRLFFSVCFLTAIIHAQGGGKIISSGVSYMNDNTTLEEVKRNALNKARSEAIRQAVGVVIYESTYRSIGEVTTGKESEIFDTFSRINKETSSGRITKETLLNENTFVENGRVGYKVEIEVEVVKEEGEADPFFNTGLKINKDVFYVDQNGKGESVFFNVTATKDCYLYLFNLTNDDSVKLLIPNDYLKNNFYSMDVEKNDLNKLIQELKFTVEIQKERQITYEAFCLIALKERHDFTAGKHTKASKEYIGTYRAAYMDIQNWLITIPKNQRTEAFLSYEIRRKK